MTNLLVVLHNCDAELPPTQSGVRHSFFLHWKFQRRQHYSRLPQAVTFLSSADIIPVALPAPPAGTTETTIDCAANARVLVPLHSSTRLHFARQRISSQCTTALTTMEPGLSFRLKDTPRMDVRPGPPTPCAVINHIIIRQTIQKPFQTEDIEARFCGSPEEPPFQISPLATTVNVTFVAKPPYIGVWEFEILLEGTVEDSSVSVCM